MKIMKNYQLLILFSILFVTVANAQPGNRYQIQSAQVNYVYSGDFSGSEQLCFENFGLKKAIIKKLYTKNGKKITATKTVLKNDTLTELNLNTHQKQTTPLHHENTTNETLSMLKAGNFKKTGEETIAGYTCQKHSGEMGVICIWKGVILKSEITVADKKIVKTAVRIDTVSAIKPVLFTLNDN